MKSLEERKLTLISQIHQLKRALDSLKWLDYRESKLYSGIHRNGSVGLYVFDASFNSEGK